MATTNTTPTMTIESMTASELDTHLANLQAQLLALALRGRLAAFHMRAAKWGIRVAAAPSLLDAPIPACEKARLSHMHARPGVWESRE